MDIDLREGLAVYAHEAWSGWMAYLFSKCSAGEKGTVIIPKWAVDRWQMQACTSYDDLPEDMKISDRKEADKIIAIMEGENQCGTLN